MPLNNLLRRSDINTHISVKSKRQALQTLADMAARSFGLESEDVFNALSLREKQGSTGLGQGVGVPHAILNGLDQVRGIFIHLETPIDYESIDEVPVDLIFALFSPQESGTEHLRALARVSRILRQKDLRKQLRSIDNNDATFILLTQGEDSNAA